jgi:hypothetical protein
MGSFKIFSSINSLPLRERTKVRGAFICLLTFKNKFFIIALENHISNGGFSLNYFKQIYLTEQQDIPQETLTFNLTPKSAVLIPKAKSEYTGKGTQTKTATFNAKIHIVDAASTSNVFLVMNPDNPVTTTISYASGTEIFSTTTYINKGEKKEINIGRVNEKGKFIKDKINVKFEYINNTQVGIKIKYYTSEGEKEFPSPGFININLK